MPTVVAFSGAIGSGKTDLSKRVAQRLGWPRVSFGDYIRKIVTDDGKDPADRGLLQRIGQTLVMTDIEGFVAGVLSQVPDWKKTGNLIVDGIRHAEVRLVLLKQIEPSQLKLVYLTVDESIRRQRAKDAWDIPQPQLIMYDQNLAEAQIPKVIRAYADLTVDNTLPTDIAVKEVITRLSLPEPAVAAE